MSETYVCPVCDYDMNWPARDYHICSRCGTEFGNDDEDFTHAQLREKWIAAGKPFFYERGAK